MKAGWVMAAALAGCAGERVDDAALYEDCRRADLDLVAKGEVAPLRSPGWVLVILQRSAGGTAPWKELLEIELREPAPGKEFDLPSESAGAEYRSNRGDGRRAGRNACSGSVFVNEYAAGRMELTFALTIYAETPMGHSNEPFAGRFVFTSAPRR